MDIAWLTAVALVIACVILLVRYRLTAAENRSLYADIRELRDAKQGLEDQLAEKQRLRSALTETMIDPVFFVDAARIITFCNSAAKLLSKGIAESGRSLMESVRSYELDSIVDEAMRGQHDLPREITVNQRLYYVRLSVLAQAGVQTGAVLILRDISELQRLGRARRDFVANISHELRTPLTAIRLLVDTLRFSVDAAPDQRAHYLDQISTQVDTLTQLAQEMYDLSLIESGQVPMRMVSSSLSELANRVMERLKPQAERAGITLENHIPVDVNVLVDPDQISRVLSNLLHNAIKFTPDGRIRIFTVDRQPPSSSRLPGHDIAAQEDYITVAVQDTGVGIARSDLPRIFERFYKVSRARGHGGTGLGLAIAKHIVEAHGGHIWAESQEGQGATFYLTVPREEQ
ncbi:MAG: cell wall metabolism sensor histidine kinase WalK [Chloroflexi bacterium]|nr:cell wall metabolism sensor histidine kinase WalK [Chloroflexota bacterium]